MRSIRKFVRRTLVAAILVATGAVVAVTVAAPVSGDAPAVGTTTAVPSAATAETDLVPLQQYEGERRLEGLLLAQSKEEAQWLADHFYPRASDWAKRAEIPSDELQQRVDNGEPIAMVILGERRGSEGKYDEAMNLLSNAAIHGSVFALSVRAKVINEERLHAGLGPSPGPRTAIPRGAVLLPVLLASRLGDYRALHALDDYSVRVPQARSTLAFLMAQTQAEVERLDRERATRWLPPLDLKPRPGAERWVQVHVDPQHQLAVWSGWK